MPTIVRVCVLVFVGCVIGLSVYSIQTGQHLSDIFSDMQKEYSFTQQQKYNGSDDKNLVHTVKQISIDDLGSSIDEGILAGEYYNDHSTGFAMLSGMIQGTGNTLEQAITDSEFQDIYEEAISSNDAGTKITIARLLYEEYDYVDALPILVELLVGIRAYDEALDYIQNYAGEKDIVKMFGSDLVMYLMFNSLDLHFKNFNRIKSVVEGYHGAGYVTDDDRDLYYALITLAKGDIKNYLYYMEQLKNTTHDARYTRSKKRTEESRQYGDVPDYYLLGLLGIDAYANGRYQVAGMVADQVIAQDENYLLGYQLHAYSSLMTANRDNAITSLKYLQVHESIHEQLYMFLEGVSLFELGKYADSVYLFLQIDNELLVRDAKRYTLLAYDALENTEQVFSTLEQMIGGEALIVHDYYTIFDMLLYHQTTVDEKKSAMFTGDSFTREQLGLLTEILGQCYQDLEREYAFVCLYGKSGLLLEQGNTTKARVYLERLVKRYQKPYLYEDLGDIYASEGDYVSAKKRYMNGLGSVVKGDHEYEAIRSKLMGTVLKLR